MITFLVPSCILFSKQPPDSSQRWSVLIDLNLRSHLLSRAYDDEIRHLKPSANCRFFSFDNIGEGINRRCRITGWIGSTSPSRVVLIPRLTAIDIIRDAFEAYPLFSESFKFHHFFTEGHEVGVFSGTQ